MFKTCSKCKQNKSFDEFRKNKRTKDGYHYSCKNCNKEMDRVHDAKYRAKEGYSQILSKSYYKHRDSRLSQNIIRAKERAKNSVTERLKRNCRSRIQYAIKFAKKEECTQELLGCSIAELKQHLESQFEDWMTWDNYGPIDISRPTWQIDHILPCSSFDLTIKEERRKCFHYTNLQPLLAIRNIKKSNKIYVTSID